jgi:hypothetical protein
MGNLAELTSGSILVKLASRHLGTASAPRTPSFSAANRQSSAIKKFSDTIYFHGGQIGGTTFSTHYSFSNGGIAS